MKKLIVFLNPGHGIDTAGKRSPVWPDGTQLREWKFNRDLVTKLMQYKIHNISWINVCPENVDISRVERIRRIERFIRLNPADKHLVFDIHGNAAKNADAAGVMVFTTRGQNNSDKVADIYLKEVEKIGRRVRKDNTDGDGDWEKDFDIIKKVSCPAILTENGFYTNEDECRWMLSHEGQMNIVGVHLAVAIEWHRRINDE